MGSLRDESTPEGKEIWDAVDRAAYRAPLHLQGKRCTCFLCSARRAARAHKVNAKRWKDVATVYKKSLRQIRDHATLRYQSAAAVDLALDRIFEAATDALWKDDD